MDIASYATPRADLGGALLEQDYKKADFIADRALPLIEVNKAAGKFLAVTRESLGSRADDKRAPAGNYNRVAFQGVDVLYNTVECALEGPVDKGEAEKYKSDVDYEMVVAKRVMNALRIEREIRAATALQDTAVWTGSDLFSTPTYGWDNVANSTPMTDVDAAKDKVYLATGLEPNTMILSRANMNYLKRTAQLLEVVKYTQTMKDEDWLAAFADLFGLEQILVGKPAYNSKPMGGTAYSGTGIWSDTYVQIGVIPVVNEDEQLPQESLAQPSVGGTLVWTDDVPANEFMEEYAEPQTNAKIIRGRRWEEQKIIDAFFAHMLDVRSGS